MKLWKWITSAIFILLIIYVAIFWFKYVYVPKGEEFDLKYTNLERTGIAGNLNDEKTEFRNMGLYTRTSFIKSGDAVEYTFDIVNDGTINAKLIKDPIHLQRDYYSKKHITYKINYSDGSEIKKGDMINAGETKTFIVSIVYKNPEIESMDAQFYESRVLLLFLEDR